MNWGRPRIAPHQTNGDALNETYRQRKERKQAEAQERQERYDALTLEEKIAQQEPFQGKQYKRLLASRTEAIAA